MPLTAGDGRATRTPRAAVRVAPLACAFFVLAAIGPAGAADVTVTVHAVNGKPVGDVAVVLEGGTPGPVRHRERVSARMEQHNRHFVPELLVVETGTLVEFPNNDSVSHQVYSFSPAKRFQLSLYRGTAHPPIEFATAGLVVLGCNIHDEMVGYILVTPSPYHGQTDPSGTVRIAGVPPGSYRVRIWSPRLADAPPALERRIEVTDGDTPQVGFSLAKALLAAPTPRPGRSEWDAY